MDLFHNITSRHYIVIYRDLNILSAMDLHYFSLNTPPNLWLNVMHKNLKVRLFKMLVGFFLKIGWQILSCVYSFKSCSVTTAHI